jgi:hypothetical protein
MGHPAALSHPGRGGRAPCPRASGQDAGEGASGARATVVVSGGVGGEPWPALKN